MIPPGWELNAIIASWVVAQCLGSLALALILRAKAGAFRSAPSLNYNNFWAFRFGITF